MCFIIDLISPGDGPLGDDIATQCGRALTTHSLVYEHLHENFLSPGDGIDWKLQAASALE